ncbi:hypothetical protein, partial [Klebsiella pneumoniae]|uniref:hypothetical protein n=1 Tax=Klebsiella pneumoniae TaxID=573 RepID=UPI001C830810
VYYLLILCGGLEKKPLQTDYVQPVNTTPLFAVGYQKPQQTHDVQPVNTNPCSQSLGETSTD